jgi:hypothetical protein
VMDFSENYTTCHNHELQSEYFSKKQLTIHVSMVIRHAVLEHDGIASTPEEPEVVKDFIFTISDDKHHDAYFVQQAVRLRLKNDYFSQNGVVRFPVKVWHEWTDGCAGQYKCAQSLADISDSKAELGVDCVRNYFGTSHARGQQDAAGGLAKAHLRRQVFLTGGPFVNKIFCAAEAHACLSTTFTKSAERAPTQKSRQQRSQTNERITHLLPEFGPGSINRSIPSKYKTVDRTQKMHSVACVGTTAVVDVREVSCYCEKHYFKNENPEATCSRSAHVDDWRREQLVPGTESTERVTRSLQAEYNMAEAESIKEGQYIAVNCGTESAEHDYFLVQVVNPVHQLTSPQTDEYDVPHVAGGLVVRGHYLELVEEGSEEYLVDRDRMCLVYTHLILLHPVEVHTKLNGKGNPVLYLSNREHARILASLPRV